VRPDASPSRRHAHGGADVAAALAGEAVAKKGARVVTDPRDGDVNEVSEGDKLRLRGADAGESRNSVEVGLDGLEAVGASGERRACDDAFQGGRPAPGLFGGGEV